MDKQVVTMAVVTDKEGVVERIGHSTTIHPAINYTGSGTKWAEEKPKKQEGKAL